VFEVPALVNLIAARLADARTIEKARAFPYQLLTAYQAATGVPEAIRSALRDAMEIAVRNVPKLNGSVAIAVDVSGSMESPVTGYRRGATTVTRCVDVAGLMAAAVLARHPGAVVLPFNDRVRSWARPKSNSAIETATALANMLGGGTAVSAPIVELNRLGMAPDTLVIVSDNQSWIDHRSGRQTETEIAWAALRKRNPNAKLVCVDLQPYTNTQATDDKSVLNVGGFGDAVWSVIAEFTRGENAQRHWVDAIERMDLIIH
jgi:60 kDa SS-A/Ro ribonucleoprotein